MESTNDWFGNSVSISGDRVVVGAFQDDDNGGYTGSAYIFERDGDSVSGSETAEGDGLRW